MIEILTALGKAAALLLPIAVFFILASMAAVKRGEGDSHHAHRTEAAVEDSGATIPLAPRELSVVEILLFATALFGLAMLALLSASLIGHL